MNYKSLITDEIKEKCFEQFSHTPKSKKLQIEILRYYLVQEHDVPRYEIIRGNLKRRGPQKNCYLMDVVETRSKDHLYFLIKDEHKKILQVKFIISSDYPFKPPEVKIGKYDYKSLLRKPLYIKQSYMENVIGINCMCCDTIICRNNWSLHYNLSDILQEIKKFWKFKKKFMEVFHCRKIVDKYFGHYLPIEEFLLYDDPTNPKIKIKLKETVNKKLT